MTDAVTQSRDTVLVVDDMATMRFAVRQALEDSGFEVEEASCGEQALAFVNARMPDLIVLDVLMPGMDGFEVCATLRRQSETQALPVLMMTSLDDTNSIARAYDAGATDFISKPISALLLSHRARYMIRARRNEQQIYRLAYYDSLTGLANRESFRARLDAAVALAKRHGRSLATMFLDLDDFKSVNDSLGHTAGDRLLQSVAQKLPTCLRSSDLIGRRTQDSAHDVVARIGGDEFVILLAELRCKEDAAIVAARILEVLAQPISIAGQDIFVTPSLGIAVYPDHAKTPSDLLKNADAAMYCAKRGGKNAYRFYDDTDEWAALGTDVTQELRRALERDELYLHYQPQLDLRTDRICGVEALLRWTNDKLGEVPATEFIPAAEASGLIGPIGQWVLRQSCERAVAWREDGFAPLRLAVNVSARQLASDDFVDVVRDTLATTGMAAEYLELEMSERLLLEKLSESRGTLNALQALGVGIAVNDFGTGNCNFGYLRRFAVNRVKIARALVDGIENDPAAAAVAKAIATLAEGMSFAVTAQGVETRGEMEALWANGCHEVQGYWVSRPSPPEDLTLLLRASAMKAMLAAQDEDRPQERRAML